LKKHKELKTVLGSYRKVAGGEAVTRLPKKSDGKVVRKELRRRASSINRLF
jgi:acyl-coenzyme A synthetase/AMP-(fatty) acid ligase